MAEPRASSAGPAPGHVASLLQPLLLERRPAGGREPVESSVLPPNLHLRPGNSEPTVLIYNKYTGGTAATQSDLTLLERCEPFCGPVLMTSFHRTQLILQDPHGEVKSASQWWCVFILRIGCPLRILW